MRVVLKEQYLIAVGAKPFLANRNVKYVSYHCVFQIFRIFYGGVFYESTRDEHTMGIQPMINKIKKKI